MTAPERLQGGVVAEVHPRPLGDGVVDTHRRCIHQLIPILLTAAAVSLAYAVVGRVVSSRFLVHAAVLFTAGTSVVLGLHFLLRKPWDLLEQAHLSEASRERAEVERIGLTRAIEQAAEGVVITDAGGTIQYVNPAFCGMTGYSAEEAIGTNPRILKSGRQDQAYYRGLWETIRAGKVWRGELFNRRKDGTCYAEEMCITPVRDSSGHTTSYIAIKKDVTDDRAAEETGSLLASIVESCDDAIIGRKLDGTIVSWNRAAERTYGYRADEVIGRSVALLGSPDRPDEVHGNLRRIRLGEIISHLETVHRTRDGSPINISLSVSPIRNHAGEVIGAAAIARDITAAKKAEQALRDSEEKYRALVTNMPDMIWTADSDGMPIFVSPKSQEIYGYSADELCQQGSFFGRVHPEDLEKVRAAYTNLFSRGQMCDVAFRMRKKDGQWLWVRHRAVRAYEKDGKQYTDGIVSNISEQKLASEMVELLQQRTELILNSAGEGILGLDSGGQLTFANPAAARMLGFSSTEVIGRNLHELVRHIHADGTNCSPERCAILRSIQDGTEGRASGDQFRPGGRRAFPVDFISTPKIEGGQVDGAVVVFRDITEVKRAQDHIQASLKEKDALLREIHHRVKNNLQIVCSLLKLHSRNLADPETRHVFDDTQQRVKAMAMVHETLYHSQDLAGINFSEYVPRLVSQLLHAYSLPSGRVNLKLNIDSVVLPIDTAIPCALILTELISNSAKHAFSVERQGELWITFHRAANGSWMLEVQDSGEGKPAKEAGRHPASFGLELVRLLTEQLSGTLRFDRVPGYLVSVTFPADSIEGPADSIGGK